MDGVKRATSVPTINVTKRTNRSLYMFLLQHMIKPFNAHIVKPRKVFPPGSNKLKPHSKAAKYCDINERVVEDIYIYDLAAKEHGGLDGGASKEKRRKRLYYFAGGGWQMPPSSEHWVLCAEMARKLPDTIISVVSYPLAPKSPAPEAFPQMMKMYRRLLQDADAANEDVILAGDSAGGNIVLCLALVALAEDESSLCPVAVLVISPSVDLRRHNPDIKILERHDPILRIPFINDTASKWRADWDPADPRVSPLYADVSSLSRRGVAVHGVVGRYDILSPDAVLFRAKCDQANVSGEWLDWEKQMHCFPLAWAYKLPESIAAKDWILDVLRRS
jgi:acetyl esterase/lipase